MEVEFAALAVAAILIIVSAAYLAPRIGVATPILLVLVGVGCSLVPGAPEFTVAPEIILMGVLPPILYAAAINVPATDFRRNLKAISGLSVLLVVISAAATGLLLWALLPDLGLAAAVALGAVISPPDAVAAISIGKRLGLPPRLVTVLEGEGLINDATALVLLRSAIAATAGAVTFWSVLGDFLYAVALASVVGYAVGYVTVHLRARSGDPVLSTAISFTVPFLAYLPAEELRASGVLSVVVAGLVTGHRSAKHFTAQDRINERLNWRTVQLLLDNGVFLLMGFEITSLISDVRTHDLSVTGAVGVAATATLVVLRIGFCMVLVASLRSDQRRAADMSPRLDAFLDQVTEMQGAAEAPSRRLELASRRIRRKQADVAFFAAEGLGWRGGIVLGWSGMRGVVTLAAAQSLPSDFHYRPQLILIAFTVALLTLVGQGGTLPLLIRRLRITSPDAQADRQELIELVDEITGIGRSTLESDDLRRPDGTTYDAEVLERARHDSRVVGQALTRAEDEDVRDSVLQRRELRRLLLESTQAALLDARASGRYSSRVLQRAQQVLDNEAARL